MAPGSESPTSAVGIAASTSSRMIRSGLGSAARSTMPPRALRRDAPAGTTGSSPKPLVGPTTAASSSCSRVPSSDSQKSSPSFSGSNSTPGASTSPVASSSTTAPGGTRPPGPTTVGAGTAAVPVTVTAGAVSSVVLRLVDVAPPGRNSATVPVTVTASPTATLGAAAVKTSSPSLVRGSSSGCGSCIQKPLPDTAVTTPGTSATSTPTLGERCAAPWMSWMRRPGSPGSGGGAPPELRGFGAPAAKSAALLSVSGRRAAERRRRVGQRRGAARSRSRSRRRSRRSPAPRRRRRSRRRRSARSRR